ncbi:MAG: excinuclease ABC subunit UvrC [Candidatus Liptonbacteria bacterium]
MNIPDYVKVQNKFLPDTPGVYIMKDGTGEIMYVGKAGNLSRRITSYFNRPHDARIERMVGEIRAISYIQVETAIEALILEAELIKKLLPPYNVKDKDDKSFLYIEITKELFPRVCLVRGRDPKNGRRFGPFTSASSARVAVRIIRRIFPFSTHAPAQIVNPSAGSGAASDAKNAGGRPCLDYQIGLCPGTCAGLISKQEYKKIIRRVVLFMEGKKKQVAHALEKEMNAASKKLDYERAERLRRQLFALQHIQDVALISDNVFDAPEKTKPFRIEGYDISNISGTSAVGSMVVFVNGKADKNEYRKFRIRTVTGSNDVAMMEEVLMRRFKNNWTNPDLILMDGGGGQVNIARKVLRRFRLNIPIVGLAKGLKRKKNELVGTVPPGVQLETLIKVRDEAHRFAISYHKALRRVKTFE